MCDAKIQINGIKHECHMEGFHSTPHVTRVMVSPNVMDGFQWDIDDQGLVILSIPPHVAELVFGAKFWRENHEPQEPGEDIAF